MIYKSIVFALLLFILNIKNVFALEISQASFNQIDDNPYNAVCVPIGEGNGQSLTTAKIKVVNDTGGDVSVNNPLSIFEFNDSSYTSQTVLTRISASSTTYSPSSAFGGGKIQNNSGIVTITANYTGKTLNTGRWYLVCYYASNSGNRLKVVGSSVNAVPSYTYYENSASYNPYNFGFHTTQYANQITGAVDMYYVINNTIGSPYVNFTDGTRDIINQLQYFSLNGDLDVVEVGYWADVKVWSRCTKSGYTDINSNTPVARLKVYADECATTTVDIGNGEYKGYEYCASTVTDTFRGDNLKVPFELGYNCTYPVTFDVFERECVTNIVNGMPIVTCGSSELYSSGSLGTYIPQSSTGGSDSTLLEPEPTDPFAWLGWKIKQILLELFSPSAIDMSEVDAFKANLQQRIPFAYGMAIYELDFQNFSLGDTSPPVVVYQLAYNANGALPTQVTFSPDQTTGYGTFLANIRPIFSIFLWLSLIAYLVVRIRSYVQNI